MRTGLIFLFITVLALSIIGCRKEAGEGGNSSIVGKVKTLEYSNGWLVGEYYTPEARVYVMYGNSTIYDDDMRTHFDGSYQFNFLYPGSYTVFAYSQCDTCTSGTEVKMATVEITDKNQVVEVPDLIINDL
jgi:hypothetical protein